MLKLGRRATDAGLRHLKGLRSLTLYRSRVTDAGLGELPPLESLDLTGIGVTDEGLQTIRGVETLILDGTKVTDAGMAAWNPPEWLRLLSLNYTAVTEAGVKLIRLRLPGYRVRETMGSESLGPGFRVDLESGEPGFLYHPRPDACGFSSSSAVGVISAIGIA